MYLSIHAIEQALNNLEAIHPFYGTTFLVCKIGKLPVGQVTSFSINLRETTFLDEYYKPVEKSDYFFRVFRISDKKKLWVPRHKYAISTLQSTRTRGVFADAFLHKMNTDEWGWNDNYVSILHRALRLNVPPYRNKAIPLFYLAVWLYRDYAWPEKTVASDVIAKFLNDFFISSQEAELFDLTVPSYSNLWEDSAVTWHEFQRIIKTNPPDTSPEEGGTLTYLKLEGVGPARSLCFEPAERLSLVTGDNGLGKTFLLECAWWALTGQWANSTQPAYPRPEAKSSKISFQISGAEGTTDPITITYDFGAPGIDKWPTPAKRPTIPGLLIYARVDGSFAICDPVGKVHLLGPSKAAMPRAYVFSRENVWDGFAEEIDGKKRQRINGLISDWVSWQNDPDQTTFETFIRVLERLSPPSKSDLGVLKVGPSVRLPDETRKIPTLIHSYGIVPVPHAAAGVKRILAIAYLMVWAWTEHKINSQEARKAPQKRMVILIDELEAHLHPQWQRSILPALLNVKNDLVDRAQLDVQSIVATHSPLVLASAEPNFNPKIDKLFHLNIINHALLGNEVEIKELEFSNRGLVDSWLTSEVFELQQARSLEAEQTIETAKFLQTQENPSRQELQKVTDALHLYLSPVDVFWPRWTFFAAKHGVAV